LQEVIINFKISVTNFI